jgi:uncharacterized protein (DUF2461 family)
MSRPAPRRAARPAAPPAEGFPPPPFAGIPADGFAFLRELAEIQDRAWYAANKARWEQGLREPLVSLLAAVADRCAAAGIPLRADPKRGVFRLHRDTRFSADKRPFKTNAGGLLSPDGGKDRPGLLYVHLEPGGVPASRRPASGSPRRRCWAGCATRRRRIPRAGGGCRRRSPRTT